MGVNITLKKNQVYIAYAAAGKRKLFAVKPTLNCLPNEIDLEARVVYKGEQNIDKALTSALQSHYNWFVKTVERLETYEMRKATVPLVARLYEEEFVNSKCSKSADLSKILDGFERYIDFKKTEGFVGNSLRQYNQTFRSRFTKFIVAYRYSSLEEVDSTFLLRFKAFLLENLCLSNASYSVTVTIFKNFFKYLYSKRLVGADCFELSKQVLKAMSYENLTDFALTLYELKAIYHFDGLWQVQKRNRDFFVANCLMGGMRISDFSRLTVANIDFESKTVSIYTKKTKKQIVIPLHPLAEEIIRRYNPDMSDRAHRLFKLHNIGSFNHSLKTIAKKVYFVNAFGEKVYPYHALRTRITEKANSHHVVADKPKYTYFKASMCRRTFITVMIEAGFGFEEVREFTGHKSSKAFNAYIKLTQKHKSEVFHKAFNFPKAA